MIINGSTHDLKSCVLPLRNYKLKMFFIEIIKQKISKKFSCQLGKTIYHNGKSNHYVKKYDFEIYKNRNPIGKFYIDQLNESQILIIYCDVYNSAESLILEKILINIYDENIEKNINKFIQKIYNNYSS